MYNSYLGSGYGKSSSATVLLWDRRLCQYSRTRSEMFPFLILLEEVDVGRIQSNVIVIAYKASISRVQILCKKNIKLY